MDRKDQKRIEQARYRAQLLEAELHAIKRSRAYNLAQRAGKLKAQAVSNPQQLVKRAARVLVHDPQKFLHMRRTIQQSSFLSHSVSEQTAKYQEWILLNEPDESELDDQRTAATKLKKQPLISILTPVFNPPVDVLEGLIESVLNQTYPHFELCLGDFGDNAEVRALITRYAKLDHRVKSYVFTENKGIADNSTMLLKKVKGEFVALLDHDDTLSPDALYENALMLNSKPYDCLYSDKDMIDEADNRFSPLFKPEWSPEMMLNINYLTHLNVMRTSIVREIGGWDAETNGAQDWDLFLRVAAASKLIGHIPKVLYHWRVIASSTAMSIDTKPYALAGQRRAVDKYLALQHVAATAYHERTELFLKWEPTTLAQKPVIFVYYSSLSSTMRLMREVRKVVTDPQFVVLAPKDSKAEYGALATQAACTIVDYAADALPAALAAYLKKLDRKQYDNVAIFLRDDIRFSKRSDWYSNLTGWLAIPGVAATCGRLVDRHNLIIGSGGLITPDGNYAPLFHGFPRYYQSNIGNAEWVRNLSILTAAFCSTQLSSLLSFDFHAYSDMRSAFDEYFLQLSHKKRLVMTPHALGSIFEDDGIDAPRPIHSLQPGKTKDAFRDPFSNPNLAPSDPMRLFPDESLQGIDEETPAGSIDLYQHDAVILTQTFDINAEELAANAKIVGERRPLTNPQTAAWILPAFDAIYAGLVNIFSFADYLSTKQHLRTTFYILKAEKNAASEHKLVSAMFPGLKNATFVAITPNEVHRIGSHDIGIATQWATAYPLAKANKIQRKCYFIQDNEVNFYPSGSVSALVSLSYRFGFMAIANTEGLMQVYQKQYQGSGAVMKSRVDLSAYHPRKDLYYTPKKPYKVFFYARPNMPRNAFELGIAGLKKLKLEFGNDIEIIAAGATWDPAAYGVDGLFTVLGKIAYEAVPKLYRSVDAGLMFMFSGHPGVTASELMASGCPVVVNEYDDVTWHELYQHEKTCLVTLPTASEIAYNLRRCLTEPKLRKTLIDGGLKVTSSFYDGYDESMTATYDAIIRG